MSIKAKPISKGFKSVARGKPPSAKSSKTKADIKTKAELKHREAKREKPVPALELTPPSHRIAVMKQQTANQNEKRIKILKQGLGNASVKINSHRRLNVLKGKARADFSKSKDKSQER